MALKATRVRTIAPIPGKDVVGIEVPNEIRETVYLKELLSKKQFKKMQNATFWRIKPIVPGFVRIGIRFERIPGRSA